MTRKIKPIHGIGINDADYKTQPVIDGIKVVCPYYRTWKQMIRRAYDPKYLVTRPKYAGVNVCDEWRSFSNFKEWMVNQEWAGLELDKDIIKPGNRVYGPDLCVFVTGYVNSLMQSKRARSSDMPTGVGLTKYGSYVVHIWIMNKRKYLGYFKTPEQASAKYVSAKKAEIIKVALQQHDKRVFHGMLRHAAALTA